MPAPSEQREPGILCDESTAGTTAWYAIASLLTQAPLDKEGHTVLSTALMGHFIYVTVLILTVT